MGVSSGPFRPADKRKREILREKRQQEKGERCQQRQQERHERAPVDSDEDPDLVGIVPGPQTKPDVNAEAAAVSPLLRPPN